MNNSLPEALKKIIQDLANPSIGEALSYGSQGSFIVARLPDGSCVLAKAGNEINSSKIAVGKDESGVFIAFSATTSRPTQKTQNIFKRNNDQPVIKNQGKAKILFIAQNKQNASQFDIYIGGDRSPIELITTLDGFNRLSWADCDITSLGNELNEWVITIILLGNNTQELTVYIIKHDSITSYEIPTWKITTCLQTVGGGVITPPRSFLFHFKPSVTSRIDKAKNIDTSWMIGINLFIDGSYSQLVTNETREISEPVLSYYPESTILYWADTAKKFSVETQALSCLNINGINFTFNTLQSKINSFFTPPSQGNNSFFSRLMLVNFDDFAGTQSFPTQMSYGFPSYTDFPFYQQAWNTNWINATCFINKQERIYAPSLDLFSNPVKLALLNFNENIDWSGTLFGIRATNRFFTENTWSIRYGEIDALLKFYYINNGLIDLSEKGSSSKGLIIKQAEYGSKFEAESPATIPYKVFEKNIQDNNLGFNEFKLNIPLTDTLTLQTVINQNTNNSEFKIKGVYYDLVLATKNKVLVEKITIEESNTKSESLTEWQIIDLLTNEIITVKKIDDQDFILKTFDNINYINPIFSATEGVTFCSENIITRLNGVSQTTKDHPVIVLSLIGDEYKKEEKKIDVIVDFPSGDDRVFYRVDISYHP